ncbi:MAG: hypothetical protein MZU97_25160 [Bacillus subtilis]|nr:hypothetical protein [Bacillus subtilis]
MRNDYGVSYSRQIEVAISRLIEHASDSGVSTQPISTCFAKFANRRTAGDRALNEASIRNDDSTSSSPVFKRTLPLGSLGRSCAAEHDPSPKGTRYGWKPRSNVPRD